MELVLHHGSLVHDHPNNILHIPREFESTVGIYRILYVLCIYGRSTRFVAMHKHWIIPDI